MPAKVAKKQKLNTDELQLQVSTSECVTFETLTEKDYPIDLINENLLRMLNYDSLQGVGELISLLIRSAGCNADFLMKSEVGSEEITLMVEQIESSCIQSGCPSAFPLQKNDYVKRVSKLIGTVYSALYDSNNWEVFHFSAQLVAELTTVHLQSLRFVSTVFAGLMANAVDSTEDDEIKSDLLVKALVERCSDISVAIRRRAVAELGQHKPEEVVRALNDSNGSVRLAALRTLSNLSGEEYDAKMVHERICEIACKDVDLPVRKSALRFLITHNIKQVDQEMMVCMLNDEDDISRKLAAEVIVADVARDAASPELLLVKISQLLQVHPVRNADVIAHGLEKTRGKYHVQWPLELAIMLSSDYDKESRKTKVAQSVKQLHKVLAAELSKTIIRTILIDLLGAMLRNGSVGCASVLEYASSLIQKMKHNENLLSSLMAALAHLPFITLISQTESEHQVIAFLETCRDIFMEFGNSRKIIEAVGSVFAVMPSGKREHLLEDIHQDLRIQLAGLLGPRGEFPNKLKLQVGVVALQLIVIGRHIDISDISKLPLWHGLVNGNVDLQQLVRAIGLKGDASTVKLVVQKLSECKKGPAVDDILRVLVSAKMRDVDLNFDIPIDVNVSQPSSETAWRAAVAAGVI